MTDHNDIVAYLKRLIAEEKSKTAKIKAGIAETEAKIKVQKARSVALAEELAELTDTGYNDNERN